MGCRETTGARPRDGRRDELAALALEDHDGDPGATGAILAAYGLIVALAIKPPLLGWIGFAIASTVVVDASCSGDSSVAVSQQGRRS